MPQRNLGRRPPAGKGSNETIVFPYVRGISEKTGGLQCVKPIFKPQKTLRNMLMHVKEKSPIKKKKEIVYEVSMP